ncbi:MAG: ABC transporter substrate-binding protein [Candidatus Rokuibacteriota bacterium]
MRSSLVLLAVLGALVVQASATAQRTARVGILGSMDDPRFADLVNALRQGLANHGHPPDAVTLVESQVPRGDSASARRAVETFARQRVVSLFVVGTELTKIARERAPEVPIVFITPGDPVRAGVVAGLGRPGRRTTGLTYEYPELSAKRLQILSELLPNARRILAVYDPRDTSPRQGVEAAQEAAARLRLSLVVKEVRSRDELLRGLDALTGIDAVLGIPGGVTAGHDALIVRHAHARRLPTVFPATSIAASEAVISYGATTVGIAHQVARALDKILKGVNAGDIPVERPSTLEFVLNMRVARALGLTVPPSLRVRADRVIE